MISLHLIIPGMKTTTKSTEKLQNILNPLKSNSKHVIVFDYESKGFFSDVGRIFMNISNFKTKARNNLVAFLKQESKNYKSIHLYGHSHGALILHRSLLELDNSILKKIQSIKTYGGASPIPFKSAKQNHEYTKILNPEKIQNFYNEKDWMINFISRFGYKTLFNGTSPITIKNESFNIQILKPESIKSINIHKNSMNIVNFNCPNKSQNAHKIPCYLKKFKNSLK
tara:strand:- start:1570 stop:2247 length:678 start_codon:yes stop_codon:yes gene_type:complete